MSHATPSFLCPVCGNHANRASMLGGEQAPKPADYTICIRCGALLVFDADLKARMPNQAELHEINADSELRAIVAWAQDAVRRFREEGRYDNDLRETRQ